LNQNTIRSVTFISFCLLVLWLIGLGWSVGEYYAGKPEKIPEASIHSNIKEDKNEILVVALGDSLTRGTGDETGKGYVGALVDEMKDKSNQSVKLTNLGINGQTSEQLRKQVQEIEIQRQLQTADYILLTIGGNDLFRGGQGIEDLEAKAELEGIETTYLKNIEFILKQIRQVNKQGTIFFIGLYNPFIDLAEGEEVSKIVRRWNYMSAEVSASFSKIVFVPTFDLFELKVNDYLYTDKFHPNTMGYRLIAERVAALLTW